MIKQEAKIEQVANTPQTEIQQEQNFAKYCNGVSVTTNIYDFTLQLTQNLGDDYKEIATVIMSPQHTKILAELLTNSLNEYEKQYGKIPVKSK